MSRTPIARCVLSNSTLEGLHNIHQKLGDHIFIQTFNDFMVMEGVCPDIPIGISPGLVKYQKLWQPGVLYTQYDPWEEYLDDLWPSIKLSGFGEIRLSKN